jgi:hypothetical protein
VAPAKRRLLALKLAKSHTALVSTRISLLPLLAALWAGALFYGCSSHKERPGALPDCAPTVPCNEGLPIPEAGIQETALGYEGGGVDVIVPDTHVSPDTSVVDAEDGG